MSDAVFAIGLTANLIGLFAAWSYMVKAIILRDRPFILINAIFSLATLIAASYCITRLAS